MIKVARNLISATLFPLGSYQEWNRWDQQGMFGSRGFNQGPQGTAGGINVCYVLILLPLPQLGSRETVVTRVSSHPPSAQDSPGALAHGEYIPSQYFWVPAALYLVPSNWDHHDLIPVLSLPSPPTLTPLQPHGASC